MEVTVLFCDIRGFSRISERWVRSRTVEWVGDVMGAAVGVRAGRGRRAGRLRRRRADGDVGGAAAAAGPRPPAPAGPRWPCWPAAGAERPLAGDARRADGVWASASTPARRRSATPAAGTSSSTGRWATTVNLASRVQGATKYFKTDLLVDGGDAPRPGRGVRRPAAVLGAGGEHRRAGGAVRGVGRRCGVVGPCGAVRAGAGGLRGGSIPAGGSVLGDLLGDHPDDGPAMLLLSRAAACMVEEPAPFDPVWVLPGK